MKIYLASRYSRRDEMREIAVLLREAGHEITTRWLQTEWVNRPDSSSAAPPEYREKYALIDMEDVQGADLVISFTEAPGGGGRGGGRGGRHVEFGAAYAWGKALIVVGHRENLFHHLPGVRFLEVLDDTPRDRMRAELLAEVELVLTGRAGGVA